MVKRVVIEVPRMNPKFCLLRCSGKKHHADAQKSYQERWLLLPAVSKQERSSNEDQGWKIIKDRDEKIPPDEENHRDVCHEHRQRSSVDIDGLRRGEL